MIKVYKLVIELRVEFSIENAQVSESFKVVHGVRVKRISMRINFCSQELYREIYQISKEELSNAMERFTGQLDSYIDRELKNRVKKDSPEDIGSGVHSSTFKESQCEKEYDGNKAVDILARKGNDMDDEDDVSIHEGDGDTTDMKENNSKQQTASYESDADEENQIIDNDISEIEESQIDERHADRSASICAKTKFIIGFKFNQKSGTSCDIDLEFPFETRKLLMISIIEAVSKKCVVREIKGLTRAFIMANDAETDTSVNFSPILSLISFKINLGTEGVNLMGMWDPTIHNNVIDVDCISTNDVSAILKTYGVEAARASIVNEVAGVFGVYGISVDPRHLGLIADYMVLFFKFI